MADLRPISAIASDISRIWAAQKAGINYAAKPYLSAMRQINKITENFGADDARSIVLYFLSNASTFRGPDAKRLKQELKDHLGQKS